MLETTHGTPGRDSLRPGYEVSVHCGGAGGHGLGRTPSKTSGTGPLQRARRHVCITVTCSLSWAGELGARPVMARGRWHRLLRAGRVAVGGICWPLHSLCVREVGRAPTPRGDQGGQPTPWGWSRAWGASSRHLWALSPPPGGCAGAMQAAISASTAGLELVSGPPTPRSAPLSQTNNCPLPG